MSEPESVPTQTDLEALEALRADAHELERIEGLLDRFNVFESIGFIGREVMHSRFLAFLLDPKQNHGLGTRFLRGFLRKVSESTNKVSLPQALNNADEGDLHQTTVRTEVHTGDGRIDILLLNKAGKWAMIVENKVWSAEHSDQLGKYFRFVKKTYPGWRAFGVYLTPFGSLPSRAEDREKYQPLGYGAVCDLVDRVLEHRGSELGLDVRVAMEHYADMVRRHIVGDPEVARLCREMYQKHKRALIIEHRPDFRSDTLLLLEQLINDTKGVMFKERGAGKLYLVFRPSGWEAPASLNTGSDTGGFLRFVFINKPNDLTLILQMTPGDNGIRRRLYQMGRNDESLFNNLVDPETSMWPTLYLRTFLNPEFCQAASDSEREQEIRRQWAAFLEEDLPRIEEALKNEAWIWESEEPDEGRSSQGSRFVWGKDDIRITKRPEDKD